MLFEADYAKNYASIMYQCLTPTSYGNLALLENAPVDQRSWPECIAVMGPVRIRHSSHDFGWQSSHSVDLAGWQAKMASTQMWIP